MPLTNAYRDFLVQATLGLGITPFNAANSRIGVGDGTTAFDPSQNDLQGTNKIRLVMDAGFPTYSGGTMTFQSTAANTQANFAWEEWGVFNQGSGGVMMNRKVEPMGTKVSGSVWTIRVSITLSV